MAACVTWWRRLNLEGGDRCYLVAACVTWWRRFNLEGGDGCYLVVAAVNKIMLEPLDLSYILQTTSSLVFSVWVGVVKTIQLL